MTIYFNKYFFLCIYWTVYFKEYMIVYFVNNGNTFSKTVFENTWIPNVESMFLIQASNNRWRNWNQQPYCYSKTPNIHVYTQLKLHCVIYINKLHWQKYLLKEEPKYREYKTVVNRYILIMKFIKLIYGKS